MLYYLSFHVIKLHNSLFNYKVFIYHHQLSYKVDIQLTFHIIKFPFEIKHTKAQ